MINLCPLFPVIKYALFLCNYENFELKVLRCAYIHNEPVRKEPEHTYVD